ncbi:MAG TPA: hypothetical protein VMZ28_12055 [Kofleriaceae bacterium]|nr:hypothetical protein [Kofleriaceae bacterium]
MPLLALLLAGTAGCDVGAFSGPGGGGDDDGDDDDGDGGGGGNPDRPDAFPAENIVCSTEFSVTGSVSHDLIPGESCDAAGTWSLSISGPTPDDDHPGCDQAPDAEEFTVRLSHTEGEIYDAVDQDDESRVWTVQIHDKGGSCAATFVTDMGGGAQWDLIPTEQSPGGPLDGTAQYEMRTVE